MKDILWELQLYENQDNHIKSRNTNRINTVPDNGRW